MKPTQRAVSVVLLQVMINPLLSRIMLTCDTLSLICGRFDYFVWQVYLLIHIVRRSSLSHLPAHPLPVAFGITDVLGFAFVHSTSYLRVTEELQTVLLQS